MRSTIQSRCKCYYPERLGGGKPLLTIPVSCAVTGETRVSDARPNGRSALLPDCTVKGQINNYVSKVV